MNNNNKCIKYIKNFLDKISFILYKFHLNMKYIKTKLIIFNYFFLILIIYLIKIQLIIFIKNF